MPVSEGYLTFVLDQLRSVLPAVRERRMFGAYGVYAGELFFAVIDDDTLFLKVDDETRGEYERRGMPPFQPMEGMASMNYSQLPEELLEESESLRPWVERAVDVARRAKAKRRPTGARRASSKTSAAGQTGNKRLAKAKPAKKTLAKETPAKKTRAKKTRARKKPVKRKPAKKTPAKKKLR